MQEFLEHLTQGNADRVEGLAKLLETDPRCCWYPSAGVDLRDLFYLSDNFTNYVGEADFPDHPREPQLFIHTDYLVDVEKWLDTGQPLHSDDRATISVLSSAYLGSIETSFDRRIATFEATSLHNHVYGCRLRRQSRELGRLPDAWLLYVVCENAAFCDEVLLANGAVIETVVHIRYGGGFGGGRSRGGWIVDVLPKLGTHLFVNEGRYREWSDGDTAAIERYLHLKTNDQTQLHCGYQMPATGWSGYGRDVMWCYPRDLQDTRPITIPTLF